jgi:hypothetical protein
MKLKDMSLDRLLFERGNTEAAIEDTEKALGLIMGKSAMAFLSLTYTRNSYMKYLDKINVEILSRKTAEA